MLTFNCPQPNHFAETITQAQSWSQRAPVLAKARDRRNAGRGRLRRFSQVRVGTSLDLKGPGAATFCKWPPNVHDSMNTYFCPIHIRWGSALALLPSVFTLRPRLDENTLLRLHGRRERARTEMWAALKASTQSWHVMLMGQSKSHGQTRCQ